MSHLFKASLALLAASVLAWNAEPTHQAQQAKPSRFSVDVGVAALSSEGDKVVLHGVEVREAEKEIPRYLTLTCRVLVDQEGFISIVVEDRADAPGPGIRPADAFVAGVYVDELQREYQVSGPARSVDGKRTSWSLVMIAKQPGESSAPETLSARWVTGPPEAKGSLKGIPPDQFIAGLAYGSAEGYLFKTGSKLRSQVPKIVGVQQTGAQISILFFREEDGALVEERVLVLRLKN